MKIKIVGGGLAGVESAWYLANRGHQIYLYDMKPYHKTPAHHADTLGELVCSNSLKSDDLSTASGLLKAEMIFKFYHRVRLLSFKIIRAALYF